MKNGNIAEKFARGRMVFSVEFFPPKTEEGARQILRTARRLADLKPDYASITYGAGGSTRGRTVEYGELLMDIFGFEIMAHLACVGHSLAEIDAVLDRFSAAGIRNVMALRGDPPKNDPCFKPAPDSLPHASDLILRIRERFPDFGVACAGYPEKHPEAPTLDFDVEMLKRKTDCGADFIVTQLFFDNSHYFAFVDKCRAEGIDKPIVAGILPALSLKQLENFKSMCSASVPRELEEGMAKASSPEESARVGLDWARAQIDGLKSARVPGVHLYILNRADSALELSRFIRE